MEYLQIIVIVALIALAIWIVAYLIESESRPHPVCDEAPRYAAFWPEIPDMQESARLIRVSGTESGNPSTTWSLLLRKHRAAGGTGTRAELKRRGYTVRLVDGRSL